MSNAETIAALENRALALDAEVVRLCEAICTIAEAREEQNFEGLLAAIADAESEALLSAEQRARAALAGSSNADTSGCAAAGETIEIPVAELLAMRAKIAELEAALREATCT